MLTVLMVALGGAIGASSRYLLSLLIGTWLGSGLPVATLAVNALGSLLLGCLVEYGALSGALSTHWRGFLAVGVLGGFTTFSTFVLDILGLTQRGDDGIAILYVFLSLVLPLTAMVIGFRLTRLALT